MDNEKKVLNPEQQEAVKHGEGPLLIIAGAGTGKTTVVTERIKHLIASNKVKPAEILRERELKAKEDRKKNNNPLELDLLK